MGIDSDSEYYENVAKTLGISVECAVDVVYLRSRSRYTLALEAELIRLHKAGNPPNIFEFGVTEQTQTNLLNEVYKNLRKLNITQNVI